MPAAVLRGAQGRPAGGPRASIMPTVGHMPHLTHAEPLARLIGDWLLPCNPEGCPREMHRPPDSPASAAPTRQVI